MKVHKMFCTETLPLIVPPLQVNPPETLDTTENRKFLHLKQLYCQLAIR